MAAFARFFSVVEKPVFAKIKTGLQQFSFLKEMSDA